MRTLRELRSGAVIVSDRSPSGAVVLLAPLLAGLGLLSWFASPGGVTAWASGVVFSCCAAAAVWAALPRRRRYEIRPSSELVLDPNDEGEDTFYRVHLVDGERRTRLLEHADVAVVLADVQRIAAATGASVSPAWGVPAELFRAELGAPGVSVSEGRVVGLRSATQLPVARACLGAAAFVSVVFLWTVLHAHAVSALSVVLPLLSIGFAVLVGVWAASRRVEVVGSSERLRVERIDLGARRVELDVPRAELLAAFAVGHAGRELQHLVLCTTKGPSAVAIAGDAARRAAELVDGVRSTRSSRSVPPSRKYPC